VLDKSCQRFYYIPLTYKSYMYLLYAPIEKFGKIPAGSPLLSKEVIFYNNVAFCPKFYWRKIHIQNGCRDISPRFFRKLRSRKKLGTVTICAFGGYGDSLWCMPLARAIKEKFPNCIIGILTDKKNIPLWANVPYVNRVEDNHIWNAFHMFSRSDEVFDFGGVATVYPQRHKLDPIEFIFKLAEWPLPKEKSKCRPLLVVTVDEGKSMEKLLTAKGIDLSKDKVVSIAVHSSTPDRDWPLAYNIDLSKALVREGLKVIWLGKSDGFSSKIGSRLSDTSGIINLVNETKIREAMAIIGLSDLFIGPNSGLMVIATALRIPSVGIFGAFNPAIRCKFYERFSAVWGKMPCSPCNDHWTECRYGHPSPCMKKALPSKVFMEAKRLLTKYPRHAISKLTLE